MHNQDFLISNDWKIENGVIRTSQTPSYWSLLPQEKMVPFLKEAQSLGWAKAILTSKDPQIQNLYLFTDCPSRSDGTFYLDLNPNCRALDLGSGWGSYTFGLAPRVKQIVAADSSLESLEFISLRAKQDGRKNISAVHIEPLDFGKLPFADDSFDAVIMNGVLEWVGAYTTKGDPLQLQQSCLKEVNRILRPGGELWIGIENRFGLNYFLGAQDDHLKYYSTKKIAYTTVLPRFIASIITNWRLNRPYRTYTHSLWGYKRLLKRAGYSKIEFYYPLQGYRAVSSKIVPLESKDVKIAVRKKCKNSFWLKLLCFFGLEKALPESYFIKAVK